MISHEGHCNVHTAMCTLFAFLLQEAQEEGELYAHCIMHIAVALMTYHSLLHLQLSCTHPCNLDAVPKIDAKHSFLLNMSCTAEKPLHLLQPTWSQYLPHLSVLLDLLCSAKHR